MQQSLNKLSYSRMLVDLMKFILESEFLFLYVIQISRYYGWCKITMLSFCHKIQ